MSESGVCAFNSRYSFVTLANPSLVTRRASESAAGSNSVGVGSFHI